MSRLFRRLSTLLLCSLLGSIMVLSSTAISKFLGQLLGGDLSVALSPVTWLILPQIFRVAVTAEPLSADPVCNKTQEQQPVPGGTGR